MELNNDNKLLESSIKAFNFPESTNLYLVINEEDQDYIEEVEKILGLFKNYSKIIITPDTQGQAETAFIGCRDIPNNFPIFFFNGDTILKNRDINEMAFQLHTQCDGAIDTFIEDTNHFSFVKLDSNKRVTEIAEKIVISNYATTGLYGFSGKDIYLEYYQKLKTNHEKYISDVYKIMLSDNLIIKGMVSSDDRDTIILGTPKEYFDNKDRV